MPVTQYKKVTITYAAGEVKEENILESNRKNVYHVEALKYAPLDSDANAAADCIAHIERTEIIDVPQKMITKDVAAAATGDTPSEWLLVDQGLEVGEKLSVGYRFGAASPTNLDVVARYHIVGT